MKSREATERKKTATFRGERQLRSQYWKTVQDCLVAFHHFSKAKALREANALRDSIEESVPEGAVNMIYHDEPYYVACDIAGIQGAQAQDARLTVDGDAYNLIAIRHLA